ncbi:MAG TPA: NAD(P)-dependent oxidoreductase [Chryseolinea sp.]|nr:NAD(P)-dependent oxidoreductase [Chryseolinea sp.]
MSRILLTGASGFIGSHFYNALAEKNFVNLDLKEPSVVSTAPYIPGDIRIEADVRRAIQGNDIKTILSLAAKHHDFGIGHDEYFDTNEDGTRVICEAASAYDIKEIVFFSSVAVYGISENISTETMSPLPDSPYGRSKLAGEQVLNQWAAEDPTRKVLIIRPTLVFGSNNMANMRNLIRQIDSGLYFHLGKANNIKSIAYVENVVAATLFLMKRMKPGVAIFNYADEPQLTTREISNIIAQALQKKVRLTIPKTLGVMMGIPFDLIIKLSGKNLPISSSRIKKLGTSTHHSAKKIFADGFKPEYDTIEGLKKMVEWYKEKKKQEYLSS